MILGMEIGLAIVGILALIRGKFTVTKKKIVEGIPARLLGVMCLTPIPLVLLVSIAYVAISHPKDPEQFVKDKQLTITLLEAAIVIAIGLFVFVVGAVIGTAPRKVRRKSPPVRRRRGKRGRGVRAAAPPSARRGSGRARRGATAPAAAG